MVPRTALCDLYWPNLPLKVERDATSDAGGRLISETDLQNVWNQGEISSSDWSMTLSGAVMLELNHVINIL